MPWSWLSQNILFLLLHVIYCFAYLLLTKNCQSDEWLLIREDRTVSAHFLLMYVLPVRAKKLSFMKMEARTAYG